MESLQGCILQRILEIINLEFTGTPSTENCIHLIRNQKQCQTCLYFQHLQNECEQASDQKGFGDIVWQIFPNDKKEGKNKTLWTVHQQKKRQHLFTKLSSTYWHIATNQHERQEEAVMSLSFWSVSRTNCTRGGFRAGILLLFQLLLRGTWSVHKALQVFCLFVVIFCPSAFLQGHVSTAMTL